MATRAVADTNVLVAAAIAQRGACGRLLTAAIEGRGRLVPSPLLVAELDAVLARAKFRRWLSMDPHLTALVDLDPPVLTPSAFLNLLDQGPAHGR